MSRLCKQAALGRVVKSVVYFLGILAALLCKLFPLPKAQMAHETAVFLLHYPIKGPMDFFFFSPQDSLN